MTPHCGTGNCSWPRYTSLGICSACEDVQSKLTQTKLTQTRNGTNWTLPNGFGVNTHIAPFSVGSPPSLSFAQLLNYTVATTTFLYLTGEEESSHLSPRPKAQDCVLFYCVRTYAATMRNGTFRENITDVWPSPQTPVEELRDRIKFPTFKVFNGVSIGTIRIWPSEGTVYKADLWTTAMIESWFHVHFSGSVFLPDGTHFDILFHLTQVALEDKGLMRQMDSMASSLTSFMRRKGKEYAHGDAYTNATFVKVRWKWAILPLALLAFGSAFVIATVIVSFRHDIPTWKSSSLPELVYSLNEAVAGKIAACGPRLDNMQEATKGYNMAMTLDGRGLIFAGRPKDSSQRSTSLRERALAALQPWRTTTSLIP